jgi:hypothetical protein
MGQQSHLIQLCGKKIVPGTYLYRADFLPSQLDQLTLSDPCFSFMDWTLTFYIIFGTLRPFSFFLAFSWSYFGLKETLRCWIHQGIIAQILLYRLAIYILSHRKFMSTGFKITVNTKSFSGVKSMFLSIFFKNFTFKI